MSELENPDVPEPTGAAEPAPGPRGDENSLSHNAQSELARLAGLPMAEHPDVYQGIHAELQAALAAIDDA